MISEILTNKPKLRLLEKIASKTALENGAGRGILGPNLPVKINFLMSFFKGASLWDLTPKEPVQKFRLISGNFRVLLKKQL